MVPVGDRIKLGLIWTQLCSCFGCKRHQSLRRRSVPLRWGKTGESCCEVERALLVSARFGNKRSTLRAGSVGQRSVCGGGFTKAGGKVSCYAARAVLGDPAGYNQLAGSRLPEGAIEFSYIGYPSTNYALDRASNLSPSIVWVGQQTNTMSVSGVMTFTNMPAHNTNNFWRVRSVP